MLTVASCRRRPLHPLAQPRAWPLVLFVLACLLGGKAPPHRTQDTAVVCPAYDPATSPLPADLPLADTAAAGALPGSFAVSRSGEATYTIPLVVPPGRAGVEPSLSITYSSAAGEDWLGVGFGLAGLSAVTRCPANLAEDGVIRGVRYDGGDHLCLDGARLVEVDSTSPSSDAATHEYRTIPDSFAKVLGHFGATGPERFEVYARSGRITEYGATTNGRAMATGGVVAAWWVTRERDRRDNAVTYAYENVDDPADGHTVDMHPSWIEYAHGSDGKARRSIRLMALTGAPSVTTWSGGLSYRRTKLLTHVDMMTEPGHVVVRSYQFAYEASPDSQRPTLHQMKECTGAGPTALCKPATRFAWSGHPGTGALPVAPLAQGSWAVHPGDPWTVADVNGDGLPDLVASWRGAGSKGFSVALNEGSSWKPWKTWGTYPNADDLPVNGIPFDYDQDGRADLVFSDPAYHNSADVLVLRSKPVGGFEVLDTGIVVPTAFRLGDLDGDGVADLVVCDAGAWAVHFWSPSTPAGPGFDPHPTSIPPLQGTYCQAIKDRELRIIDLDGDGKPEILIPPAPYYGAGLGEGAATWHADGTVSCGGGLCRYDAVSFDGGAWTRTPTNLGVHSLAPRDSASTTADISGSPDLVLLDDAQGEVVGETIFVDVNGDGLPDAVKTGYGDGRPRTFLNTGKGFSDQGVKSLTGPALPGDKREDAYASVAQLVDYDGDGRTDLLVPMPYHCGDPQDPSACWVVWRSTDNGTFAMKETGIFFPETATDEYPARFQNVQVLDANGDGRHDLVALLSPGPGSYRLTPFVSDGPQDLLLSITDGTSPLDPGEPGFIPTVAITYGNLVDTAITKGIAPSAQDYESLPYISRADPDNDCAYPRGCVTGPERVVASYAVANGRNEARTMFVKYRDGRFHRRGRGSLGFGERIVLDGNTAAGSAEFFDNVTHDEGWDAYPYAGQVVRSWAWSTETGSRLDPGRVEVTFTERSFMLEESGGGLTYFTLPVTGHTLREEGVMTPGPHRNVLRYLAAAEAVPLTVLGEWWDGTGAHDSYGNALIATHQVDGADAASTVHRTYDNDPAAWLIGKLRTEEVCSSALGMTQCRTTALEYDDQGEVRAASVGDAADPGTQLWVTFVHDKHGHVVHATADDAFGHHRDGCVSYDAEGIFPYAARNALGHTTYSKRDAGLGVMTAAVDANGLVTQFQHDRFGRVTEERRPDGTRSRTTLARTKDGGPQAKWWATKVTTSEDGGAVRTTELDSLGRAVRSLTVAAAVQACGAAKCSPVLELEEETAYDFLGRVESVTLPWMTGDTLTGKLHHTYSHDAAGRLTKHVEPWGKVTTFAHGGLVDATADWLGTTMTVSDALGRTVKAYDRKDYAIETAYGPFGLPWQTTRFGTEVTTSERDAYGRVVHETDMDRGDTHISYDGFGEALTVDDAAGRHTDFRYDALGRLVRRDDLDGTTKWTYDTAAHGIGRVASVENPVSVKQLTYDPLSRPEGVALALGTDTFAASFGYDAQGRLRRTTYPQAAGVEPLVVLRDYDAHGNLVKVRDNAGGVPYWQLTGLDGAGRAAVEAFGNGTVAHREYEPGSGMLRHIHLGAGLATKLQDLTYAYDEGLRMRSRADGLQVGPKGVRTETFTHDEIGRLTCARFADIPAGKADATRAGPCALAVEYAANGNITHKSDVGAYAYDPVRPHAVQTAGAATFGYDGVGNQTERPGLGITYTAFDLPSVVTDAGSGMAAATFAYDGDQQRIRKQTPQETTVYFEEMYERATAAGGAVVHRYYVAAGSATLVLTRQAGQGKGSAAYLHTDALGSTDLVTADAGSILQRRSYDAFGARRHPVWGQAPAGAFVSKVSRVGFTGHEDEDDLGLVNMRGRIYDPKVGRFLQTDPFVSTPASGQSWNPYSYVHNSPLNFTDPSGFQDELIGTYDNLGSVSGTFPGNLTGPEPNWNAAWGKKPSDAVQDDAPAGVPQAVQQGSPFAANGMAKYAGPSQETSSWLDRANVIALSFSSSVNEVTLGVMGTVFPVYGAYRLGVGLYEGHRRDGAAGAINSVNPLYGLGVGVADVVIGVEMHDDKRLGSGAGALFGMAVVVVAGGAEAGREGLPQGGTYRGVRVPSRGAGGEVHHMPSWAAQVDAGNLPFTRGRAPGIMMESADHMKTGSWGSAGAGYRETQTIALREGRFLDVLARDIQDVESIAPGKYSANIQQMLDHLWSGEW
jgi:RHS repeat-associated protein